MITLIIVIAVGVGIAALIAGAWLMVDSEAGGPSLAENRLDTLAKLRKDVDDPSQASALYAGGFDEGKDRLDALLKSLPGMGLYLEQADLNLNAGKFFGLVGGLFAAGIGICFVTPIPILLGPILGAMLASIPFLYVMFMRNRRMSKFGNQMPEALELLSRSLRAGHSLAAGFGLIASEMRDPIRKEFARCFEEQNLGIALEEALDDMTERVPNMDLKFFAMAIILQRETGGDLAEILDKISHLVRERLQIQGQVAALTGEGRMSGIVLLAMPPTLFLTMLYLNYDYAMMLFTDPMGRKMMAGALVMQLLGAVVIRKIITIRV
ncbi:Bacterial type II secretion system protein F domain protein [Rosistilla carotiformis]|uniref:Bacterial type II secretion system protein F domain protein n=1 Tax=Rosistilla carotiformis TaxID=2528017 RepID=A0A518JW49_9BACT|nr:type II secretion system F family protein [Rosistilla carotiformis]QDV69753.1 Bacterial type II secretion system protein F domain protein [Rosistilla carotiformis]